MDADQLDRYRSLISLGRADEGTLESIQDFLSFDFDWKNQWKNGVLYDIGFGFANRRYPNQIPLSTKTPLGEKRTDLPFRFSTALGWKFMEGWSTHYHLRYGVNLSNKVPTVRIIQGIELQGAF